MLLTDTSIKNAKPRDTDYKLADEKGLYVLVKKAGKYFRLDYRFLGIRKTLALGVYPEVSLKEARDKRDAARKLLIDNIDPLEAKKIQKSQLITEATNNFQAVAVEWHEKMRNKWSERHARQKWYLLEKHVFPVFGKMPNKKYNCPRTVNFIGKNAIQRNY